VTRADGGDVDGGAEQRRRYEAHDGRGLSMEALVITDTTGGVVRGAGVQCVWKTAEGARATLCRGVVGSLRRAP
jgi:hypothetical protein